MDTGFCHPAIFFSPSIYSSKVSASMLIAPTCASLNVIRGRLNPLEGGITIAHYTLSDIVPAVAKVPNRHLIRISSAEAEVSFSDRVLTIKHQLWGGFSPRKSTYQAVELMEYSNYGVLLRQTLVEHWLVRKQKVLRDSNEAFAHLKLSALPISIHWRVDTRHQIFPCHLTLFRRRI